MKYVFESKSFAGNVSLKVFNPDTNQSIFDMQYPSFTEEAVTGAMVEDLTLVELGVIKSMEDTEGIESLLKQQGIITQEDTVISLDEYKQEKNAEKRRKFLKTAIELLSKRAADSDLPFMYKYGINNEPEATVAMIAEQAQSQPVGDLTVHAKDLLEQRFGEETVEYCIAAFPQKKMAAGGSLDKTDPLYFPTDEEVKEMGEKAFIQDYLKKSHLRAFGTMDGFETWKKSDPSTFNSAANNAVDVYDEIVNAEEYKKYEQHAAGGNVGVHSVVLPELLADQVATKAIQSTKMVGVNVNQKSSLVLRLTDYLIDKSHTLYKKNHAFRNQIQSKDGQNTLIAYMSQWSESWLKKGEWKFADGGITIDQLNEYDRYLFPIKYRGKKLNVEVEVVNKEELNGNVIVRLTKTYTHSLEAYKSFSVNKDELLSRGEKVYSYNKDDFSVNQFGKKDQKNTMGGVIDQNIKLLNE